MARRYSAVSTVVLLLAAVAHLLPEVDAETCKVDSKKTCTLLGTCTTSSCKTENWVVKFEPAPYGDTTGTGALICFESKPTGTLSLFVKDKTCPNAAATNPNRPPPPATCPFTYTTVTDLDVDPCSGSDNSNQNGVQYGCTTTYTAPSSGTAWTPTSGLCPLADVNGWQASWNDVTDCVKVSYYAADNNCLVIQQVCTTGATISHISLGDMTCDATCPSGRKRLLF